MALEFRRPLGLVLSGGGALAAWQAGFMDALVRRGLVFDRVMAFSGGTLNGLEYFLGWRPGILDRWRAVGDLGIFRFSPRLCPPSLFSSTAIWEAVERARDESGARAGARCDFIVVSLRSKDKEMIYSRFTPHGEKGWDGPLADRIVASCSIPFISPPARIEENGETVSYVDGGVPGRAWMRGDALEGCADVLVLEMVRPEEVGRRFWSPWKLFDQKAREVVRRQINSVVSSLQEGPSAPRIFRAFPSRTLEFAMLSFKNKHCSPAVDQGASDAALFLDDPEKSLIESQY